MTFFVTSFFSFSAYILSSFSLISDFISPTTHTRGCTDFLCCYGHNGTIWSNGYYRAG